MPTRFQVIKALDKAAAVSRPEIRAIFERAAEQLRAGISAEEIARALTVKSAGPILDSQGWTVFAEILGEITGLDGPLRKTLDAAATMTAAEPPTAGLPIDFEGVTAAGDRYLELEGARLVRDVTEATRASINGLVRQSFTGGKDLRQAARSVLEAKRFGLTGKQTKDFTRWTEKLYARAASPRSELFGASERQLQRMMEREFGRRLRNRARTIARTESYSAGNAGRRNLWEAAVDQGVLDAAVYELEWVTRVIGVCPRCQALHLKRAAIKGGVFVSEPVASGAYAGQIITIARPTVHPLCYCALRTVRIGEAAASVWWTLALSSEACEANLRRRNLLNPGSADSPRRVQGHPEGCKDTHLAPFGQSLHPSGEIEVEL